MKIYQETIVDGMFSVPDLKLDWELLLSDKYKLWAKYKYALLKFYYSPNHEGSCTDVAQEFNDNASSLNALIMNFGRAVQKAVGDFAVMRNNKMQYWIISMNGYNDEKNHFVWRLRPDLTDAIKKLRKEVEADVILAEPVGSCADLTATIIRPMKKYLDTEVLVSPLTVLSDPMRLRSIIYGGDGGLHEDAAYIYRKQLEESEIILITKTDLLSDSELEKLKKDTQTCFPHTAVMSVSTQNGIGVVEWLEEVGHRLGSGKTILDINYDKYAHGEAVLGWLNGTVSVSSKTPAYWDTLLKDIMNGIAKVVKNEKLRVGHVKVIAENGAQYAVGNITGDASTLQLRGSAGTSENLKLIVNARVETSPEHLNDIVKDVIASAIGDKYDNEILAWRFLQPGRPNPTHRIV